MIHSTSNGVPGRLQDAIQSLESQWREELAEHGVRLAPAALEREFGSWVLPVELVAGPPARQSWDIEEFLRRVEQRLERESGERITLYLDS